MLGVTVMGFRLEAPAGETSHLQLPKKRYGYQKMWCKVVSCKVYWFLQVGCKGKDLEFGIGD